MKVISIEKMNTGLNNQRICLLGLIKIALDTNSLVRFPVWLPNYAPNGTFEDQSAAVAVSDVFDIRQWLNALKTWPSAHRAADEVLSQQLCFKQGNSAIRLRNGAYAELVRQFLLAAQPAQETANKASDVLSHLAEKKLIPLQLRIERDWSDYLARRNVAKGLEGSQPDNTLDPDVIFRKIRSTPGLDWINGVWACCDEDDLTLPKEDIKRISKKYQLEILFKSDIDHLVKYPNSRIMRANTDFSVSLGSPAYIGITNSTFSNMIGYYAEIGMAPTDRYVYNDDEKGLRKIS